MKKDWWEVAVDFVYFVFVFAIVGALAFGLMAVFPD